MAHIETKLVGNEYVVYARCPKCNWVRWVYVTFHELWAMRHDRRPQIWCDPCTVKYHGPMGEQLVKKNPERNWEPGGK